MPEYDITVKVVRYETYRVEAPTLDAAYTQALEQAINSHPGADVWIGNEPHAAPK